MASITHSPNPVGFFTFNDKTTRYVLAHNSIIWLEAARIYTIIHLKEKSPIVCSQNIGDVAVQFLNGEFYRIHRSHIVNLNEVVLFENRVVLLSDDTTLTVAHREVSDFLKAYCEIKNMPLRRRAKAVRRVG